MKPEQRFWNSWLRDRLPTGHATRIESEVSEGFPDVHFTLRKDGYRGISVTFELKVVEDVRFPLKGRFTRGQKFWIPREVEAGGLVWIVVQVKDAQKSVYFIPGRYFHKIEELIIYSYGSHSSIEFHGRHNTIREVQDGIRRMIIAENNRRSMKDLCDN